MKTYNYFTYFLFFIFFSFVSNAQEIGPYKVTKDDINGMVTIGNHCSGSIINFSETVNLNESAKILTAGHCVVFDQSELIKDQAIVNGDSKNLNVREPSIEVYGQTRIAAHFDEKVKLLYATKLYSDLAILELPISYGKLKKKGVRIRNVSKKSANLATKVQIVSGLWRLALDCKIGIIPKSYLAEGIDRLLGSSYSISYSKPYIMEPGCFAEGGWSGSPIINDEDEIIGVTASLDEIISFKEFVNFPKLKPYVQSTTGVARVLADPSSVLIGANTFDLHQCLLKNGKLSLDKINCSLQKPYPAPIRILK